MYDERKNFARQTKLLFNKFSDLCIYNSLLSKGIYLIFELENQAVDGTDYFANYLLKDILN